MTLSFCLRFGCDYRGPGDVCGSNFGVSKTEDWLRFGCPILVVDGSVCLGGGPLIKLFVMGCL
jgi:hypothetical protein